MPKRAENQIIAFDLKAQRKARKLSQVEVAEILCASQASITRWESSGKLPLIYRRYWDLFWKLQETANKVTKQSVKH